MIVIVVSTYDVPSVVLSILHALICTLTSVILTDVLRVLTYNPHNNPMKKVFILQRRN